MTSLLYGIKSTRYKIGCTTKHRVIRAGFLHAIGFISKTLALPTLMNVTEGKTVRPDVILVTILKFLFKNQDMQVSHGM